MTRYAYRGSRPHAHSGPTPVRIQLATRDRKLAPIELRETPSGRRRPQPAGPFMVSTYVSIGATCPSTCSFKKSGGCYVLAGFTGYANRVLDEGAEALQMAGRDVITREVELLDRLFLANDRQVPQDGGKYGRSGRDLRLHVGGDTPEGRFAALELAMMADRWHWRRGGRVFTYTHNWERIPRGVWGRISVLASVESWEAARRARGRGYVPAIVVQRHETDRAYQRAGMTVIPCPAETRGTTCVKCRLCLNVDQLHARNQAIAFVIHGSKKRHLKVAR